MSKNTRTWIIVIVAIIVIAIIWTWSNSYSNKTFVAQSPTQDKNIAVTDQTSATTTITSATTTVPVQAALPDGISSSTDSSNMSITSDAASVDAQLNSLKVDSTNIDQGINNY